MKYGKKYLKVAEKIEKGKIYSVSEAVKIIKDNKTAKFDESVEAHAKLSINTKKGEEQVRGSVVLPHGTGKSKKVAVITSTRSAEARESGADIVEGEGMIAKIKEGKAGEFDVLVATPEMMPKLAQVAKILGPKGLMPSPKTETVTEKIKETVSMLKKGKVNFKNDDSGNIHQIVGKVSFAEEQLAENIKAFLDVLQKNKPSSVKNKFILSAFICSTMGPGIRIK